MALRLSRIAVYPVKSLAAVYPDRAKLTETGLRHDRAWMIVDDRGRFITQRQFPRMALVSAQPDDECLRLTVPGAATLSVPTVDDGARLQVEVWRSRCDAVDQGDAAAALLSGYLGRRCRLVRMREDFRRELSDHYKETPELHIRFADSTPLTLISQASLDDLNARLAAAVQMDRFRPNLVVEGGSAFQEDEWRRVRIGEATFRVVRDCIRCEIPTIDQATGEKGVEPNETLESYRAGPRGIRFGRKLAHEILTELSVGDEVTVLE